MTRAFPSNRLTAAFERRVRRALDTHVDAASALVLACSAGPDSTAALIAVAHSHHDGPVVAANFDHGIRPVAQTSEDRRAVEALASRLGVRCVTGSAGAPRTPASERWAREARYGWLAEVCAEAGARHCVTGHTLDDQAETVVLRLARGTGLGGAAAMAEDAPWPVPAKSPDLRLVRPLLTIQRLEVMAYLDALEVEPRFDATNDLVTFDRNRVRHRVLPELRAINPRADEAITRFAARARRDDEALEAWAARELAAIATCSRDEARIARRSLQALPEAVASRVLRQAAATVGLQPDGGQVATLLRLSRRRGSKLSLARGEAVVGESELVLARTVREGR